MGLQIIDFETCKALGNRAKLSYSDPINPEYNRCFLKAESQAALTGAAASPSMLVVSAGQDGANYEIKIFVDPLAVCFWPF